MSFDYRIYGLQITSSRSLDLLQEKSNSANDLIITWTKDEKETPYTHLTWTRVLTDGLKPKKGISVFTADTAVGKVYKLFFHTAAGNMTYLLSEDQKKLWIVYEENVLENDLNSLFVGPGLGTILRLKGAMCLHASVVNIDGYAVAFLGKKRSGKSTMAAAFVKMGYDVLADDMAVVKLEGKDFYVASGYPKVRLRPLALAALHPENTADFKRVYSKRDSMYSDVEASFREQSLPLKAVYILNKTTGIGNTPLFEDVTSSRKLISLSENAFGSYILTKELRKDEFMFLGQLANTIPIRDMKLEHNLEHLDIHCRAVVEDFRLINKNRK